MEDKIKFMFGELMLQITSLQHAHTQLKEENEKLKKELESKKEAEGHTGSGV